MRLQSKVSRAVKKIREVQLRFLSTRVWERRKVGTHPRTTNLGISCRCFSFVWSRRHYPRRNRNIVKQAQFGRMSNSDCSSYQSVDPRKYEFPPTSPTRFDKDEKLDDEIELISEVCSPLGTRLIEIIHQLRSEMKDLYSTNLKLQTKDMETEYTLKAFYTRVAHLEKENKRLEGENKALIAPPMIILLVMGVVLGIIGNISLKYLLGRTFA